MWVHFLEFVRWLVLLVSLVNVVWLTVRMSAYWERYPTNAARWLCVVLMLFVLAGAYGTGEAIARDIPVGSRAVVVFVAEGALTCLLWSTRGGSIMGDGLK
jgi:hypothetical protein